MSEAPRTTVYFDGACPVCSREMAVYRRAKGAAALDFVDVSGPACPAPDLSREAALARMHARLPDGRLVSGAAAFGALWSALPGWRWLGRLVRLPGVSALAEVAYGLFLRLRRAWRRPR
ncbi:MAG: DUF393 domain-containing protein [Acetobacteraceae bacterium]|nr:DUF393 domain-containing protein [Acetobacteraceae bacterium]